MQQARVSAFLVTAGLEPDLQRLELEKASVKYTSQGILIDGTLRTSAPNIYASGDIVGPYQLASAAHYQGILAATKALLRIRRKAR
mgnify:CR=1 FL=1